MTSSGCQPLDRILHGVWDGDIVLWQLDALDDCSPFVEALFAEAVRDDRQIVYLRFVQSPPICHMSAEITIHEIDASGGFERATGQIHEYLDSGPTAICLVDCLSLLDAPWVTDLMIGNLLSDVCRRLRSVGHNAYIPLLRNRHCPAVLGRIQQDVDVVLDLYRSSDDLLIHPIKVAGRYSPTMFLPHRITEDCFAPLCTDIPAPTAESAGPSHNRILQRALDLAALSPQSPDYHTHLDALCRFVFGDEERMLDLARRTLNPEDFIAIGSRMIGDGAIGGRAAGLVLARRILRRDEAFDCDRHIEPDDPWYVGADVFCTYLFDNDLWEQYTRPQVADEPLTHAARLRERILAGSFSETMRQQFRTVLDYFGQSPLIVRSSSILQDSFRGAFAGKYESIFLANQGDPEHRLRQVEAAVKRVYSSTLNDDAIAYRHDRGLHRARERMALVVQKVSGSARGSYFFPDLAGVGASHNLFAWAPHLDRRAGMLRLVLGLGTRAVDRTEDDYPQIVPLDDPNRKPYARPEDAVRFSQHEIDVLNIETGRLDTLSVEQFFAENISPHRKLLTARQHRTERTRRQMGLPGAEAWIVSLDKLLSERDLPQVMQTILHSLERAYDHPVDIEFTINLADRTTPRICLVQCRPMQSIPAADRIELPPHTTNDNVLFNSTGHMMGAGISCDVANVLLVRPAAYCRANLTQKYEIARIIGRINRVLAETSDSVTMMLAPGRWGTSTPSLGVPVSFAEINSADVLVEIACEGGNLMPELSFGTHFFHDLVENDIFYVALFPDQPNVTFNDSLLLAVPNRLPDLLPESAKYADCVALYDTGPIHLKIVGDAVSQQVICLAQTD